jgi:hypothetical protein
LFLSESAIHQEPTMHHPVIAALNIAAAPSTRRWIGAAALAAMLLGAAHAGPAQGPVASDWKLSTVRAGSRDALVVQFDGPTDVRAADHLAVADEMGRRVRGRALLRNGEGAWSFRPTMAWRAVPYTLVARAPQEDPAGLRLDGQQRFAPLPRVTTECGRPRCRGT